MAAAGKGAWAHMKEITPGNLFAEGHTPHDASSPLEGTVYGTLCY
jgi:hypothetical protein